MNNLKYIFFVLLIAFGSCQKVKDTPGSMSRTILVYMGGDNDLYQEADEKIEALRTGYTKGMGRLLIYCDQAGKTPRLLEISAGGDPGTSVLKTLKNYPQENSASAGVITHVLQDVKIEAPAASYGLLLFSHASGWLPQGKLTKPSSIAQDKSDELELTDFAAAIPDGFFDFIVFESCFMSGIEVAYELKDKAHYIVASSTEILSPGFTPVYPQLLPTLYKPEADLKGFSKVFFDYYNNLNGVERSATVSVINTAALPVLAEWIKQNASKSVLSVSDILTIQHLDRYPDYSLFFDFENYYQKLIPTAKYADLNALINSTLVYKAATPVFMLPYSGFEIKHFSGLTSYIPQRDFPVLNEQYKKLAWSKSIL